ncbi:MAG: hypothetical protein ACM359_24055, partial [Bacillota bacterium]
MNFVSWAFVVLFAVVFGYRLTLGRRKTEGFFFALVILASTTFVMWHVPVYVLIMLTSIVVDYAAAIWISHSAPGSLWRKGLLALSISINLGLLGFFKYTNFAIDSLSPLLDRWNINLAIP